MPWMSSSDTALATTRLGNARHEAGEVANLLHALSRRKLQVVAAEPGTLALAIGTPVTDPFARHREHFIGMARRSRASIWRLPSPHPTAPRQHRANLLPSGKGKPRPREIEERVPEALGSRTAGTQVAAAPSMGGEGLAERDRDPGHVAPLRGRLRQRG